MAQTIADGQQNLCKLKTLQSCEKETRADTGAFRGAISTKCGRRKVHQQGFMSEESPQMVKETQYRAKAVDKLRGRVRDMGRAK